MLGKVKFWSRRNGRLETWGMIALEDGSDIYVHREEILDGSPCLLTDEAVEFELVETERGRAAVQVKRTNARLRGEFISLAGNGYGYLRPLEPLEDDEDVFIHFRDIEGAGHKSLEIGEVVEFSLAENQGRTRYKAVNVLSLGGQSRHALEQFADIAPFDIKLHRLAQIAAPENWNYSQPVAYSDYPILTNYIYNTFKRVQEEEKIATDCNPGGQQVACFNTGLVTRQEEDIYGYFEESRQPWAEWALRGFFKASDPLLTQFRRLPDTANYFTKPADLLYDPTIQEFVVNYDHIIEENIERFPEAFRYNKHLLRQLFEGSVQSSKKRASRNYHTAIPQWFEGKIQLLFPLCFEDPNRADIALVVSRENQVYRASTVLTLDMAYNNARLLTQPGKQWLHP